MGGFSYLQEFLAEDFVIGQRTAELGHEVVLSSSIIQHRIGSQAMIADQQTGVMAGPDRHALSACSRLT